MTVDAIREARNTSPFTPFIVHTADGGAFQVPNHDSLLVAEQGQTIIVVTEDQKFHILATDLIASISR